MSRKMDAWGSKESLNHMEDIVASIKRGAEDVRSNPLRIPFVEWAAKKMVRIACSSSRPSPFGKTAR